MKTFFIAITVLFLILYGFISLVSLIITPIDNSDKSFFKRSDLKIHTDYKTGCQYLSTFWGGITPRLDKDGKQICIESEVENAR